MIKDSDTLARKPNHALEQMSYTYSAVFDADLRRLCYCDWRKAALSAKLPKTGADCVEADRL